MTPRVRIGVYAGASLNTYAAQPMGHDATAAPAAFEWMLSSSKDFLATRVSYKLQLTGPSVTVQTACSTSLVAVHAACQALRAGECEIAVAGGVSVTVPPAGTCITRTGSPRPTVTVGRSMRRAAGTVAGNGVGVVVLKPLLTARADGDHIHAVIRGTAINNDGADKVGFTAPSVHGQAAVIAAAQRAAGVAPETIGYVEAHGTGTPLGDPIEVAALRQVFGDGLGPATCGLGSVKGNVGHLDAAAGVTGLIKTVLALERGAIPPSLHFTEPHPELNLGPFFVPTATTPWPSREDGPRRAGVSSFGMGGTNAHVILEAPDSAECSAEAEPARPWQIVPVSGHTPEAVAAAAHQLAMALESPGAAPLADAAFTAQLGRATLPYRRVAVATSGSDAARALRGAPTARRATRPPLVWLFPGQGTVVRGQGAELDATEPVFRRELDACAAVVAPLLGGDMRSELYDTHTTSLDPVWTQVGLVAIELGLAALWRSWGLQPTAVLGHSVGELAAAVVAGVLTREAALILTVRRAQLMATARGGGMLAVMADRDALAAQLGDGVTLAAVNGPRQTVVAGSETAVVLFGEQLTAAGIAWKRLPTTGAFHSPLMEHVVAPLTAAANTFTHQPPQRLWISSVTAAPLSLVDPDYWGRQVVAPVLWHDAMMAARHVVGDTPVWLEVGPGHTLTHLARAGTGAAAVASLAERDSGAAITRALGNLWVAGCAPDWAAYHAGERRRRVALPTYPFQRQRYWLASAGATAADFGGGTSGKTRDASRWFYVPSWSREAVRGQVRPTLPRRVLLFADPTDLSAHVSARLQERGCQVVRIEPGATFGRQDRGYVVNPDDPGQCRALIAELGLNPADPTGVLHLWALGAAASNVDAGTTSIFEGLPGVLHAVQAILSAGVRVASCLVATADAQDVTGDEAIDPGQASITGLLRVAALEHPELHCRSIDVSLASGREEKRAIGRALADELLSGAEDLSVALRGRHRWVAKIVPRPLPVPSSSPRLLRPGGTYLVTGGLGRIGLGLADYLTRALQANVILLGRSEPTTEVAARLTAWRERGAEIVTVTADVGRRRDLARVLEEIDDRYGGLSGVVHAAGLTQGETFAPIASLTPSAFAAQWMPKAGGALQLAALLAGRPLDVCVLMSSLSTTLGGLGFGAYASANAVLDAVASAQSRTSETPWLSIAWDGWAFDPSDATAETAKLALTLDEGIAAFARVLEAPAVPRTIVSTADLHARLARWFTPVSTASDGAAASPRIEATQRRRLDTPFAEPATETACTLAPIWEELLGVQPVGADDDFFALGGHSLLGTQLMSRVRERFGVDLSLTALFNDPTVAGLSARIDGRRAVLARENDPLERIKQLSADDRRRLLDEARRAQERSE